MPHLQEKAIAYVTMLAAGAKIRGRQRTIVTAMAGAGAWAELRRLHRGAAR